MTRIVRKRFSFLLLFMVMTVLSQFGQFCQFSLAAEKTAVPKSTEKQELKILLDWFVNPDHAPLFIAKEKGFFAKRGLDVEIIAPADPKDPPKLVAAGKADLAITYQPQHLMQVDNGLPLIRIATLISLPLNTVMVLADSGIENMSQLKGKTIGYSVGGFETMQLETMLNYNGLTKEDVKLVNVNFSLTPALLTGRVDAVIGAYANFELNQLALEGKEGRAFNVEENGMPPYDELIIVAQKDKVQNPSSAKVLRRFVDALEEGTRYLVKHPEESWQLFIKSNPDELGTELNKMAWRDTLPFFALRPATIDKKEYLRLAEFFKEKGLIKRVPEMQNYAVELP